MNALENPRWNFWQALYLILIVYVLEFVLGWLKPLEYLGYLKGYISYLVIGFGEGLLFFVALFIFFKILHGSFADLGLTNFNWKCLLAGLGGGIVLFFAVGLLGNVLVEYFGQPEPQSFALVVEGVDSIWQLVPLVLLGGIIVPLKEEMVFRGLIYPPLRQGYGKARGILFTGLFFGLMHFDLIRFVPLVIGGLVLTFLYERSKSLWTSVIAHGVWNILMVILMWWQRG